jgi:hypothetical protein
MSKDLPQPQESEEVDLGQLFKLIGGAFDRFFKFIGNIFNKLFLAFVWFVFFLKQHFLKFVIAGIVGIVLGVVLERTSESVYKSYIIIKQNYNIGENLYNVIGDYNDLVKQGDIGTLGSALGVNQNEAESILEFEIESVITENQKLKNFDKYLKTLDSALASTVTYKAYIKNSKEYNHQYQQITIKAKERNNFKAVFGKIVDNINLNTYFTRELAKDRVELTNQKQALEDALVKSDSLQITYKRVLEKTLNSKGGSEIGITFEGTNDKDKTREYDLYQSDLEIQRELVNIEREIADKEYIIEITFTEQDSGSIDNRKEIFGKSISPKIYYAFILTMLTFIVLLGLSFIKFLERYKDKI